MALVSVSAAVPVFPSVTIFASLDVLTTCVNVIAVGDSDPAGPAEAVPFSATICGLPGTASANESVPIRVPLPVGENVTDALHDAYTPPFSASVQLFVAPKSPAVVTPVTVNGTALGLVIVTFCGALVPPCGSEANVSIDGYT